MLGTIVPALGRSGSTLLETASRPKLLLPLRIGRRS